MRGSGVVFVHTRSELARVLRRSLEEGPAEGPLLVLDEVLDRAHRPPEP
jgi:carbamoylphosphate synthase large subunit